VNVVRRVDHLVYAAPDLDVGVATLERLLGVRASAGGSHPQWGTRNALLALGAASYLEIIAPDPAQTRHDAPRPFGLDALAAPRLATWCANTGGEELGDFARNAERHGIRLGAVRVGSRTRPDGVALSWRFTDPSIVVADGVVPFFIDWGKSQHPARTAAQSLALVDLRAEHPQPDGVQSLLNAIGLDLGVQPGPRPALIATLHGPRGRVEVR
jgi:Glyoxalase-like domain